MATMTIPQPERLRGRLIRKHRDGYGFLSLGQRDIEVFILQSQLPPEAWRRGVEVEFTLAPGRRGARSPRAVNPVVVPAPEDPNEPDHRRP